MTATIRMQMIDALCKVGNPQSMARKFISAVAAEAVDEYPEGKYYRAHIGQRFQNGRYRALCELGYGAYARVWLGKDTSTRSNVAMKFISSERAEHEFNILRHLCESPIALVNRNHPGRRYIEQPLDKFKLSSKHTCLTFRPLGMSVAERTEGCQGDRLPGNEAKSIIRQLIECQAYLRLCGIEHGDIRGQNILIDEQPLNTQAQAVPRIKLIDFGSAYFHRIPPKELHTPLHMRPPEVLAGLPVNEYVGRWQLGCNIFEFTTGRSLIIPSDFADELDTLKEIESLLGSLPADLVAHLKPEQISRMDDIEIEGLPLSEDFKSTYLEETQLETSEGENDILTRRGERANQDLSAADQEDALRMIRSLLVYSPQIRNTEENLLSNEFFRELDGVELLKPPG